MKNITFTSLSKWPENLTPSAVQKSSPFWSKYLDTVKLLEKELKAIKANSTVLQAFFSASDLKNNGLPYSNAIPKKSGVILNFKVNQEQYSYPCDKFTSWEDNLRAIALTLKALRDAGRYGVTVGNQAYAGFKQLAAPNKKTSAIEFISTYSGVDKELIMENVKGAYIAAARKLHTDKSDGDNELFVQLGTHYEVLKEILAEEGSV